MNNMNQCWRVAFISHSPHLAGAERSLANFILNIDRERFSPITILPGEGPLKKILQEAGIPCFNVQFSFSTMNSTIQTAIGNNIKKEIDIAYELADLLLALEVDLVVINTGVVVSGILAAILSNLPKVLHLHGIIGPGLFPGLEVRHWRAEEAFMLANSDLILAPSYWVKSFFQDTFSIEPQQIRVIPNGIVCPTSYKNLEEIGDCRRFVQLCTLEPNKNIIMFLEAARQVVMEGKKNVEFHIYGDGVPAYCEKIEKFIVDNGLGKYCYLHPRTQDIENIYNNCYAAVVTSQIESFSLVAIEAMSYGRPVISTKCGGPEEIIVNGDSGFLIEQNNAKELAEKMCWLIDNPEKASHMGRTGRLICEEKYDVRRLSEIYMKSLSEVCENFWLKKKMTKNHFLWNVREGLINLLVDTENSVSIKNEKIQVLTNNNHFYINSENENEQEKEIYIEHALPLPSPIITGKRTYKVKIDQSNWCGIKVMFGTHQRVNQGTLSIRIYSAMKRSFPIRTLEISLSQLPDNAWVWLKFDPIKNSKDHNFIIEFQTNYLDHSSGISIYEWQKQKYVLRGISKKVFFRNTFGLYGAYIFQKKLE